MYLFPVHLVPDFLICTEEQGLGFHLVSLIKADMKAWSSHWKCEVTLFISPVLFLWLAKVKWLLETASKSFFPFILAYDRAKAD